VPDLLDSRLGRDDRYAHPRDARQGERGAKIVSRPPFLTTSLILPG